MSHICANAIKSMEEGWNGDLVFVGLYSVIIYIECIYVGLQCLCKLAVCVYVYVQPCAFMVTSWSHKTFLFKD